MIFVYKTTNLLNGKIYVGVHKGSVDDNYLGSGRAILSAVAKYGKNSFRREIIRICASAEEAFRIEAEIVNAEFVLSENTYNMTLGGGGGWYHAIKTGDSNVMRRPEVAQKVSESIKKSITPEEREKRSSRMKAMRANGTVIKPKGWNHTHETKQKISKANIGKSAWNTGLQMQPESAAIKQKKSESAKIRAATQDMGELTRGKIRKPSMSCIKCKKKMYAGAFNTHQRGICWTI